MPNVLREEAKKLNLSENDFNRSILNPGNKSRIAKVIKKAMSGELVTIGFFGGSITHGDGASSARKCYANLVTNWWKQTAQFSEC